MRIADLQVRPFRFPLEIPFKTTLGIRRETQNVLVSVDCGDGLIGYGEASTSLAMPEASPEILERTLRSFAPRVKGRSLADWETVAAEMERKFPRHPTARAALECALLDAWSRWKGRPLYRFFGKTARPVETHYTISALPPKNIEKSLKQKIREGFRKFKVKVTGTDPGEDFARIEKVHRASPRAPILVDANQAWSVDSALRFMDRLTRSRIPVSLIEQPLPKNDLRGMARLRKQSPFPIAADESCRSLERARRIAETGAADCLNLKLAKSGLLESIRIADYAKKMKLKLMIGCMMESPVGLSVPVHWACGSGDFSFVDLDSFLLLRPTPFHSGFTNRGPRLSIRKGRAGTGVQIPA